LRVAEREPLGGAAPPLTLGTAGHIDHGKTALIAALTGVDTDRLPEERARGISIELGYARLRLPSGRSVSVVDVPGHERFVRTMVAGATGVDMYLMTVAADDGVMPQTREHAAVLAGLGIDRGVVAITKADVLDVAPAAEEARALLPDAPVVAVSARTGQGLDELRAALDGVAARLPGRVADGAERRDLRLHVDRAFTIRGAGTVVTGTLWSGSVGRADEVVVLPAGLRSRVRAVQVHDEAVDRALPGQRVALNLVGVALREVERGDLVASPAAGHLPTHVIDAELELGDAAARFRDGGRVQVHHGTREAPARLAPLGGRFFQLRLERPLLPARGDRLIVRQIAPPDTLGGGTVLDPEARKHGPSREALARLERLLRGEPEAPSPARPEPARPAAPKPAEPLSPDALALARRLGEAGHQPPIDSELGEAASHLPALRAAGRAVRVGRNLHFHATRLAEVQRLVTNFIARHGSITIAQLRDELGTTRKFAQSLLEHFDSEKVTRRVGDAHVLRRQAAPAARASRCRGR
jgi:selenocysteine-specific elongation factor